jgi:FAD/FMN-containing dehydrogenase
MSKVAHYLQEHLLGEVTTSPEVRLHFAKDASVLRQAPAIVVYPRNESDVRKTARFAWQLAERGKVLPITARGGGSDTSGAAIGSGIILVFTAHMNRILTLDPKKQFVVVEPGVMYDKLEQTLFTHGLFLPPYPASKNYATIGGGIGNNAIGEKSVKYGVTKDFVKSLRVVLANGEIIETGRLTKRELNRKLGLSTLEGEVYRSLDKLLEENAAVIAEARQRFAYIRSAAGYNLWDVKKGSGFDLTPLIVGSQGTLGIITEASMDTVAHNPVTKLALISLESLDNLNEVLPQILSLKPSICDMINQAALQQVGRNNANLLKDILGNPAAAIHLFVEFDDEKDAAQKRGIRRLEKLVEKLGGYWQIASKPEDQEKIWKVRHSVSTLLIQSSGQSKAVPVAEDVAVPVANLPEFLHRAAEIYSKAGMTAAAWGHAGDGVVRMHPLLDLGQVGDRQKLFKIAEDMYRAAIELGGTTTAASGDGRVRAPYLPAVLGRDYYRLCLEVKKIFDPMGVLNPGVKTASIKEVKELMRGEYSLSHRNEYLPRS